VPANTTLNNIDESVIGEYYLTILITGPDL
jgi:hypothetical protein